MQRLACSCGIHWRGRSDGSFSYDEKYCFICGGRNLLGWIVHDESRKEATK
jgi:hypothetical protein